MPPCCRSDVYAYKKPYYHRSLVLVLQETCQFFNPCLILALRLKPSERSTRRITQHISSRPCREYTCCVVGQSAHAVLQEWYKRPTHRSIFPLKRHPYFGFTGPKFSMDQNPCLKTLDLKVLGRWRWCKFRTGCWGRLHTLLSEFFFWNVGLLNIPRSHVLRPDGALTRIILISDF